MVLELFEQKAQRQSGVENVFDDDHVLSFDWLIHIFVQLNFATRAGGAAVTRYADEVEGGIKLYLSCQVAKENGRALQYTDEQDRFPLIISRYLSCQFGYTGRDLLTGYQYPKLRLCCG